jgi:CheY-like chemotaxis protein
MGRIPFPNMDEVQMTASRPSALIVEDQPIVGLVTSDVLSECGFETFHAYDAKEAASILEKHPEIEVVVSEAQLLGDLTGLELCRQVSRERPDIRLIVLSSDEEIRPTDVPKGTRLLRKPYSSRELRTLIGHMNVYEEA